MKLDSSSNDNSDGNSIIEKDTITEPVFNTIINDFLSSDKNKKIETIHEI